MRKDQAITKYQRFPPQKKKKKVRTYIVSSQIVNHQVPNFQGTPERCRQTVFGQPMEKSRKNAINFLRISGPTPKYSYIQT